MSILRSSGVNLFRKLAKRIGGVMLSERAYSQLILQRGRAVAELAKQEQAGLNPGLAGVVFSKDRALQLYTLLHTYFKLVENPAPLSVIYGVSDDAHAQAYAEVEKEWGGRQVRFVREQTSFRETLQQVLAGISTKNIFFLVDDIVFIRPLDLQLAADIDTQRYILSLRHSPHLCRSYTANVSQPPPNFRASAISPELLEFNWFEQGNEWSDPWSVDGQVLSTAEIKVLTRLSDFAAPNSYEGTLKTFNDLIKGRVGLCYAESRILNLPINRVQEEVPNLSGSVSPEFLLAQWNKGLMLDTSPLDSHIPVSPHEEHVLGFKPR